MIRTSDDRPVTAADSVPWRGGIQLKAIALNTRGQPIPEDPTAEWSIVHWSISDASIFEYVSTASGINGSFFGAKGVGTATLTATIDGKSAQVTLKTYLDESKAVWVWPDTSRMLVGTSRQLVVRDVRFGTPIPTGDGVHWESSTPSVATVDQQGSVTTTGEGRATITAVISGRRIEGEVFSFRYLAPLRFSSVTMASGYSHLGSRDWACGITTEGALYCWGLAHGALGTDEPTDRCMRVRISLGRFLGSAVSRCSAVPVPVRPDLTFTSVTGSQFQMCGLANDGAAYCWGNYQVSPTPTAVSGNIVFKSLDVGASGLNLSRTCGVGTTGTAYCWGETPTRPPGSGQVTRTTAPVEVPGGLAFESVRVGRTVCGITTDGATYCWGQNDVGQAGAPVGTNTETPTRLSTDIRFTQVEPGANLTCALDETGSAYCWGAIGTGTPTPTPTPVPVSGGLRFARLATHMPCGVTSEGALYCWSASLVPTARELPFAVGSYGRMNGPDDDGIGLHFAIGTDGLLRWWDQTAGRDPSTFFFHSADAPDGLIIGSTTPVLVPGQQ
jgi:hypothetical protein